MKRELEYFTEVLDDPASFGDEELSTKIAELVEFVEANGDKYDFCSEEWAAKIERVIAEAERRDPITPEMREELLEIEFLHNLPDRDNDFRLQVAERLLNFMKKYQAPFEFTDEQIAEHQEQIEQVVQAVAEEKAAQKAAMEAECSAQKSLEKLDDCLAAEYERTGKPPVLSALQFKKPPRGN